MYVYYRMRKSLQLSCHVRTCIRWQCLIWNWDGNLFCLRQLQMSSSPIKPSRAAACLNTNKSSSNMRKALLNINEAKHKLAQTGDKLEYIGIFGYTDISKVVLQLPTTERPWYSEFKKKHQTPCY